MCPNTNRMVKPIRMIQPRATWNYWLNVSIGPFWSNWMIGTIWFDGTIDDWVQWGHQHHWVIGTHGPIVNQPDEVLTPREWSNSKDHWVLCAPDAIVGLHESSGMIEASQSTQWWDSMLQYNDGAQWTSEACHSLGCDKETIRIWIQMNLLVKWHDCVKYYTRDLEDWDLSLMGQFCAMAPNLALVYLKQFDNLR